MKNSLPITKNRITPVIISPNDLFRLNAMEISLVPFDMNTIKKPERISKADKKKYQKS